MIIMCIYTTSIVYASIQLFKHNFLCVMVGLDYFCADLPPSSPALMSVNTDSGVFTDSCINLYLTCCLLGCCDCRLSLLYQSYFSFISDPFWVYAHGYYIYYI